MKKPHFISVNGQLLDSWSIVANSILPHANEAMLLEGVTSFTAGENPSITAVAELWEHRHYFVGHFPGKPVCPGHILLEMANLTAALFYFCLFNKLGVVPMIRKHGEISYHTPALPGDMLHITCSNPVAKRQHFFCCAAEIRNQKEELVLNINEITGAIMKP